MQTTTPKRWDFAEPLFPQPTPTDDCERCHGEGTIDIRVSIDNIVTARCPACGGDGLSLFGAMRDAGMTDAAIYDATGEMPF